ncbi:trypsin-like peptidase domain-containing protein [Nocardioides sp. J2M5]|uniref:S1C family serine protease n=1 Tax=Nocardioides palaemonis TaxID=2829810 RepID=UPI001BAB04E8|nr:trypsin-like peptidase domain-containing protein [Nocardioides palaemonis]MBS2939290.1 trypsin-like peptidase domain-containing protein [Nocardioides palaemonis]
MSDGFPPQNGAGEPADQSVPTPQQQPAGGWQHSPGWPAPGGTLTQQRPPRRRRAGLAAAVVATSLLVGGGAGIGGAAFWDATHDDPAGSSSASPVSTSTVSSQTRSPAADGSVESVAQKVLPSVVKINVSGQQGEASGSGIILTADGTILTNNHVVELAENGGTLKVDFNDGTSADAEILGTDPLTDTAVIKASGVSDLTPATIGKSANLGVGEGVVAIGSPFGLDATVTSGIVSALDRPVNVGSDDQGNSTTYPAIQTDAAINPGNSGGPLVDMSGAVIGINSSIRTAASQSAFGSSEQSGSIGLGFAIPIDEVMPIVDQMAQGETPTHARLGIRVGDDASGAKISDVTAGSTAADAGIQAGDVITSVDGKKITGADSLVATIRSYRPGDKVSITWTRGGDSQEATVTLDSDATSSTS